MSQHANDRLRGAVEKAARRLADAHLIHSDPLAQQEVVELTESAIRLQELSDG